MQRIHLQHDFPFNWSQAANYQTNQRKIQLPLLLLLIQFKCLSQIWVASLVALLNAHAIQSKSQRKHSPPPPSSLLIPLAHTCRHSESKTNHLALRIESEASPRPHVKLNAANWPLHSVRCLNDLGIRRRVEAFELWLLLSEL